MLYESPDPHRPCQVIVRIRSDVPERDNKPIYLVSDQNNRVWDDEDLSASTVVVRTRRNGMSSEEDEVKALAARMNHPNGQPSTEGKMVGGSGKGPGKSALSRKREREDKDEDKDDDKEDGLDHKHVSFNEEVQVASIRPEASVPLATGPMSRKRRGEEAGLYPQPPRHPDAMTDEELQSYIDTLNDVQYEAFMEDFDLESASDTDDDEKDDKGHPQAPAVARTELPDGAGVGTPLQHVGLQFATNGPGGVKLSRKEQKLVANGLADPENKHNQAKINAAPPERASLLSRRVAEGVQRMTDRRSGRELELYGSDTFQLEPSEEKRECLFIVGPQGSGKSYFCAQYARRWKQQHPDGEVIVFSQLKKDPALDRVGITRVEIDSGLIENPYEVSELGNCLVIFDDIDMIRDTKLRNAVRKLCDSLLEVGRKENAWVIRTSHQARNWSATRSPLAESDKVVFFLNKGAPRAIRNYLKDFMCWPDETIQRVLGNHKTGAPPLKSRWVVVCNIVPQWFLGEHLLCIV